MEIDNHILALSMEFEKQNIIVTEWETEKAKNRSDRYANHHVEGKPDQQIAQPFVKDNWP